MANKINFTANGAPTRNLKAVPARYKQSAGRPNISQSDGVRPAFPLMPIEGLTEAFEDITTGDSVVIPKGRLVSAITSNDTLGSGLGVNTYFGVPKGIMGFIVPANGGVARTIGELSIPVNTPIGVVEHDVFANLADTNLNYTSLTHSYGVLSRQLIKLPAVDIGVLEEQIGKAATFLPATEGDAVEYTQDVLIETDGTYTALIGTQDDLVYDITDAYDTDLYESHAHTDDDVTVTPAGAVTLTSALVTNDITVSTDTNWADGDIVTITYQIEDSNAASTAPITSVDVSTFGYADVENKYSFYTYNSEKSEGLAGDLLKSDYYGNFMPTTSVNAQTVGRLLGVDFRFQKDLLDTVQNPYQADASYRVSGTGTMGVPQFLFDFAYAAISGCIIKEGTTWAAKYPSTDAAAVVKTYIDAGAFGEAWIQLNI